MTREEMLQQLEDPGHVWDMLVVGGGATGLGAALEGASRGYRTLLLERDDFAKGTSSRSTKLIHGGVRYLRQGNLGLVSESLHERGVLLRNAPHLVHDLSFVVPFYDRWEGAFYGAGLRVYDILAGRLGLGRSRLLGRAETLERLPTVEPEGLRGGVIYHDGQFDDSRLAVSLARTMADLGGMPLNYLQVTGLVKEGGVTAGVVARDLESGREYRLRSRVVVNATGVFADSLRRMDDPQGTWLIAPSQGVHIVLDRSFLPGPSALMIPRTTDGRLLFAVPWHGRVLVGTTDTPVGALSPEPRPLPEEIDFLLDHAARYLTRHPTSADILSTFAGLRPLVRPGNGRRTAAISRGHAVLVSRSGMVTVAGGKWTTYRQMGEDAVDQAAAVAGLPRRPSITSRLEIHGWEGGRTEGAPWEVYGSDAPLLQSLAEREPALSEPLHPDLPYRACEVVWAVRSEWARTVEDVLARRTRALFLDARASMACAPRVAELMARELGKDNAWQESQVARYQALARGYLPE